METFLAPLRIDGLWMAVITPENKYIKARPPFSGNTGIPQNLFTCLIAGVIPSFVIIIFYTHPSPNSR